MVKMTFPKSAPAGLKGAEHLLVIAPHKILTHGWLKKVLPASVLPRADALTKVLLREGGEGKSATSVHDASPCRITVAALPDEVSRHNSPTRKEEVIDAVRASGLKTGLILAGIDDPEHVTGVLMGAARAFPLFERKTSDGKKPSSRSAGTVGFLPVDGEGKPVSVTPRNKALVEAAREAARLVDTPAADLSTQKFAAEARRLARGIPNVKIRVLLGTELSRLGLNGIHAVGDAAVHGPRLVLLDYRPPKAKTSVALVGKGVVYDTGGLSLKPTAGMCSMKGDMGGAAAVLGAFCALAKTRCKERVLALIPLAENSVDSKSYRPDDILVLHSGHTVEINNTDAEGRLLLADAVSYAARTYSPRAIIDAATLTGAQLIATGDRHSAVMSNRAGLEGVAVRAGRSTGDLAFPLPFAPEFYQAEFHSAVADMKNSVKNRMNAQSSCAAQFVYSHIDDLDIPWLHIDLAGPAFRHERGTGYGVALIAKIVEDLNTDALKE